MTIIVSRIFLNLQPILLGTTIDVVNTSKDYFKISFLIISFCLLGFLENIATSFKNYNILLIREGITQNLNVKLLEKLQKFSHKFFLEKNIAEISKSIDIGQKTIHTILVAFFSEILPLVVTLPLICFVIIYKINFLIGMVILIIAVVYSYIGFLYITREKASSDNLNQKEIKLESDFYENNINFETIKITYS